MANRRATVPGATVGRRFSVKSLVTVILSFALLPPLPVAARMRKGQVDKPEVILDTSHPLLVNATASLAETPGSRIPLLDCAYATGSPNGLTCDKEGTFVVGWEKRGQWIAGGGAVPLSRALCCRLGIPNNITSESMPNVPLSPAKPVAVVSFGCHPSKTDGPMQVMCENQAGVETLLSGYTTAVGVGLRLDTYYPLGAAQCCTPALLLENGDLWSYERCNCRSFPGAINCPYDQGWASMGFSAWRMTRGGNMVPIAPVECCQVCLGDRLKRTDECADLDKCNGRGHCSFGKCECFRGWAGPDCGQRASDDGAGLLDSWQLAVVIIGATGMLASLLILCSHLYRMQQREDIEGRDEEFDIPFLLDEVGSVGDEDTSDEDEHGDAPDDCAEEEDGEEVGPRRSSGSRSHQEDANTQDAVDHRGPIRDRRRSAEISGSPDGDGIEPVEAPRAETEEQESIQDNAEEEGDASGIENFGTGECLICMLKPVQVVIIPCGHAVCCRRCSRRMTRCPVCRKDVLRRQRLFF